MTRMRMAVSQSAKISQSDNMTSALHLHAAVHVIETMNPTKPVAQVAPEAHTSFGLDLHSSAIDRVRGLLLQLHGAKHLLVWCWCEVRGEVRWGGLPAIEGEQSVVVQR